MTNLYALIVISKKQNNHNIYVNGIFMNRSVFYLNIFMNKFTSHKIGTQNKNNPKLF